MAKACRGDRCVLLRGVVITPMVLEGEFPLRATLRMGGGVLIVSTGELINPTLQDVALMSVSGRGPMLAVGMVSVEYGGASSRWYDEVTNLK